MEKIGEKPTGYMLFELKNGKRKKNLRKKFEKRKNVRYERKERTIMI